MRPPHAPPPRACVTLTHALHQDVGRIAQHVFLWGKTVPSRRGHHYGGTWPGPSSTGALGAGMHRSSGFKLPQASILAKSYLESLVISNNYLQHLPEASTATLNNLLMICSTVLLGRRFSRRHSLILYYFSPSASLAALRVRIPCTSKANKWATSQRWGQHTLAGY